MTKLTEQALKGSIKKWTHIVGRTGLDFGIKNCPLCRMFYNTGIGNKLCNGCPVSKKSTKASCRGTPYEDWEFHYCTIHLNRFPYSVVKGCKTCLLLAKKELEFLKSLLPRKKGVLKCSLKKRERS